MAEPVRETRETAGTKLFDKYLLPKIALGVILLASFVGTAVTLELTGRWDPLDAVVKWAYFVALGILTGGLTWKHLFVRPADLETDAIEYCERMYERFDRLSLAVLFALGPGAYVALVQYASAGSPRLSGSLSVAIVGLTLFVAIDTLRNRPVDGAFRATTGVLALGFAVAAVILTAVAEVSLRTGGATALFVRVFHLLAFAIWIGGAVWNLFVAVPSGQERPTTAVIRAAGEQLERFRWTVRVIIPTLLLTGLVQSVHLHGYSLTPYARSVVGVAIAAKLGFVALLFVIFTACPMWRACSPIDGVCDLEELAGGATGGTPAEGVTDD